METPIELSELMERIRALAAAPDGANGVSSETPARPIGTALPPPLEAPPAPEISTGDDRERVAFDQVSAEAAAMLPRARQKTEVSRFVPKTFRPLCRNQGGFNGILLETLERLLKASEHLQRENLELHLRLEKLEAAAARQHAWTDTATAAQNRNREWMTAVESYLLEVGGSHDEIELRLRLKNEKLAASAHAENESAEWRMSLLDQLKNLQTQADDLAQQSAASAHAENKNEEWRAVLQEQVNKVDSHADRLGDQVKNLQTQADDLAQRSAARHAEFRLGVARHDLLQQNARRLEERQHNDAGFVKNQLWFLERLIEPLLGRAGSTPTDGESRPTPAASAGHELDALYLAFEDVMRGSREEVKERVAVYLPYVGAAKAGTAERPVLDLGCGRGEWLELLGEHRLVASGVDLNTAMIEVCRERNLPATQAEVIEHLRATPGASCGAVTAFHLIEHLPFPVLVTLLREIRRVLPPGGIAIFETPNPYNVLVGSGFFYHDFTHQRPLPPTSTKFLVEQLGFTEVEVLPLHPWDEAGKVHGDEAKALEWRFNELFYGPQDYALIARA